MSKKIEVRLSCLRNTPSSEPELRIDLGNQSILLANGMIAEYIFVAIHDEWKKQPEFGYTLELKPFDCDHIKEGKIITLIKEDK